MNTLPFSLLAKFPYHRHDGTSFHDFYDKYLRGFFEVVGIIASVVVVIVVVCMICAALGVAKEQAEDHKKQEK